LAHSREDIRREKKGPTIGRVNLFVWDLTISSFLSSKFLVGMIFSIERDGALLLVKHINQKAWCYLADG
jgi:hypothetical protein